MIYQYSISFMDFKITNFLTLLINLLSKNVTKLSSNFSLPYEQFFLETTLYFLKSLKILTFSKIRVNVLTISDVKGHFTKQQKEQYKREQLRLDMEIRLHLRVLKMFPVQELITKQVNLLIISWKKEDIALVTIKIGHWSIILSRSADFQAQARISQSIRSIKQVMGLLLSKYLIRWEENTKTH